MGIQWPALRTRTASTRTAGAFLGLCLLATACGSATTTETTTAPTSAVAPSTTAAPTTTQPTTTTMTAPTTTTVPATTTTVDEGLIGSQAAYDAIVNRVYEEVRRFDLDVDKEDIPLPDLRQPDPLAAFEEALRFDLWVFSTLPTQEWTDVWIDPRGSYDSDVGRVLDSFRNRGVVIRTGDEPWTLHSASITDQTTIGGDTLRGIELQEVTLIAFESSLGDYTLVNRRTGAHVEDRAGWHFIGLASVVPTEAGWQIYDLLVIDK